MPARRYVVHKIGDRYVSVLLDPYPQATAAAWTIWGGILTLAGLRRRDNLGAVLVAAGGMMAYRGITGRNPVEGLSEWPSRWQSAAQGSPRLAPSYQNDYRKKAAQLPDDVDEASMESFPASDAPGRTKAKQSPTAKRT